MANGFLCKYCGYQETAHDFPDNETYPEKICLNFTLSKKDKKLNDKIEFEEEHKKMEMFDKINQQQHFLILSNGIILDIGL